MKRFNELGLGSAFAMPNSLKMIGETPKWALNMSKIASGQSAFTDLMKVQEKMASVLGSLSVLDKFNSRMNATMLTRVRLAQGFAVNHKFAGVSALAAQMEATTRTVRALGTLPSSVWDPLGSAKLSSLLGPPSSVEKLAETMRGISSRFSLLETSPFSKALFPDLGDKYGFLRTLAAGTQAVEWMRPLTPAMASLAELAEQGHQDDEDWVRKVREILSTLTAGASRANVELLISVFGLLLALMPNQQIRDLSEQTRQEFRQLREEIETHQLAAELNHEQLLELQLQVLHAARSVHSEYVATIEIDVRVRTRRSGRAHSICTLGPGEPVIVLALQGRWAYVEAEIGDRHVVGWVLKKALSKPRRALLPDLAVPGTGSEAIGGHAPTE